MTKHERITQDLLEVAQEILIVVDRDSRVQMINPKGCETVRCLRDEIIGQDWCARFIPERIRDSVRQLCSALMTGQIQGNEYREDPLLTADGEERMIRWHNKLLYDDQGRIDAILASGIDITDQRRMEQAARQAQSELETAQKELTEAHDALAAAVPI